MAKYNENGPPATPEEIENSEQFLKIPLPDSYKRFLQCAQSVSVGDGLRIDYTSSFVHEGGPSDGMLCFADFWLEGDGDQALFDVSGGLVDGEYPVYYYNHDTPSIRKIADSFREFIEHVVVMGDRLE